jgi:hypothetical protein
MSLFGARLPGAAPSHGCAESEEIQHSLYAGNPLLHPCFEHALKEMTTMFESKEIAALSPPFTGRQ